MNTQLTLFNIPEYIKSDESTESYKGKPRIKVPVRNEMEFKTFCLDDLIPQEHKVRFVWKYVQKLDMSEFITKIQSVQVVAGRPATDPRLLLSLWIYATIKGIGSGRVIETYKKQRKQLTEVEIKNVRASPTDPEARKMKMANGGFSPAYNVQLATDTKTQLIVGLSVSNAGSDIGKMTPMYEQVNVRYNKWTGKSKSVASRRRL